MNWGGLFSIELERIKVSYVEVGVGDRVKLWTDLWCGDSPLQLIFPIVYGMVSDKGALVASSLE